VWRTAFNKSKRRRRNRRIVRRTSFNRSKEKKGKERKNDG
jgi:hypothetical protein